MKPPAPRLEGVELAAAVASSLQRRGFYAARHSTSILVMRDERIVASIHVYGRECILRPYKPYADVNRDALREVETVLRELCGGR